MNNIFIDLDGVLVDLERGYKDVVGIDIKDARAHYQNDDIWEIPKQIEGFWSRLPLMPDAEDLIDYVTHTFSNDRIFILSAAVRGYESCMEEKREWIRNFTPFGQHQTHIVHRSHKKLFSTNKDEKWNLSRPNILIDDYDRNVEEWVNNGGTGIIHTSAENTISNLNDMFFGKDLAI